MPHRVSSSSTQAASWSPSDVTVDSTPPTRRSEAPDANEVHSFNQKHSAPGAPQDGHEQGLFELTQLLGGLTSGLGTKAQDKGSTGTRQQTKVSGAVDTGFVKGQGSAQASTYADANYSTSSRVGPDGAEARFSAGAQVGVEASAQGSVTTPVGSVSGRVRVSAEVYARASGYAKANFGGAQAGARADVGAMAKAEAQGNINALGGLAKADVDAVAESGSGATATGKVAVGYSPLNAVVAGAAGAFAGARASFSTKVGVPGASGDLTAEAWAGVGAKAEIAMGINDGKFRFSIGVGAALGVGAFLQMGFEIDLNGIGDAVKGAAKGVGDFFSGLISGVAKLFGGDLGDGKLASSIVEAAAQGLGSWLSTPAASGQPTVIAGDESEAVAAPENEPPSDHPCDERTALA